MMNSETERSWQEIQARVDELLRQSLAGNFFYRIEYGPGRETHRPDTPVDDRAENRAERR